MKLLFIITTLILSGCTERTDAQRTAFLQEYVQNRVFYVLDRKGNCYATLDSSSISITLVSKEMCE